MTAAIDKAVRQLEGWWDRLGSGGRAVKAERQRHTGRTTRDSDPRGCRLRLHAGRRILGLFDIIGIGPADVRLVQVKCGGAYLSAVEREQITMLAVPPNVSRECWRFPDRCRAPIVERL